MSATPDEEVLYIALGPPWDDEEQQRFYSEDEARDEKGQWTDAGGAAASASTATTHANAVQYHEARALAVKDPEAQLAHRRAADAHRLAEQEHSNQTPSERGLSMRASARAREASRATKKFSAELFYSEDQERDEKGRWTLVGDASHLGGTTAKQIYQKDGQKYLFKPDPAIKILGAEAASKIGQLVNPGGIVASRVEVGGKAGLMQQLVGDTKPLGPLGALSKEQIGQLQREHVVDWITSQHDSHPGQFIRDASGKVLGTDKSQAWKYFPSDKLQTNYHPNAKYGERPPIYNTLFGPGGIGRSKMDPEAIRTVMDRVKQITPEHTATILHSYAASRFGQGTTAYRDFIKAAHERIASAPKAFSDYYSHVLGRHVKFGAGLSDEALRRAELGDCSDLEVQRRFEADFDESKHPRAPDGKFEDGGGMKDQPAPELVKTGEGDPAKSLEKQKQLETWKKYGKVYREKKARLKEEARLKALGQTPPKVGEGPAKMETSAQFIAMANEWKKDAVGYESQYVDQAIAAAQSTAHPEYAQNWINLVNEHGGTAVAMALSQGSNFKSLSDRLAAAKTTSLDPLLKGPRVGQGLPNREGLKIAAATQLGFTVREYTHGAQAVASYAGSAYTKINGGLRELGNLTGTGKQLDTFLGKLPDVTGAPDLYRAFTLGDTKGVLATALKAGHGNFTDPAFVSATTSLTWARGWKGGGTEGLRDSFLVSWKNEGGFKNATPWGGPGQSEGEVIGRPGSKIEILSSHYNGGSKKWEVSVRWLPNPSHSAAEPKVPSNYKPPPMATPKISSGAAKTHFYEKHISPNTGKAYYIKKKIKS